MTKSVDNSSLKTNERFLEVHGLNKNFGNFTALENISLSINEGEFVCFLGPSGCGKTTLLRAIAGLDYQTSGQIFQKGKDISALPPVKRDFGIVFQSYALFPNLSVEKNIAYGLSKRQLGKSAVEARVQELLTQVGLPDSGKKYPAALSGGQQQRVALARALATSPGMLLLDEPLSALDAKVRVHLRHELRELQRTLGITTIMVTHDQEEALAMADRIVVMNHGHIEQVGTPEEIYSNPQSAYVADFIGEMNFWSGSVESDVPGLSGHVRIGTQRLRTNSNDKSFLAGSQVTVCIRPEDVQMRGVKADTPNSVRVSVKDIEFLGSFCRISMTAEGFGSKPLICDVSMNLMRDHALKVGDETLIALPIRCLHLFSEAHTSLNQGV
ncbi:putative 2-aminoethylphosphonate ABC transporter ATP-binding protein [Flexibacterium corallicola]|uniref:putative 2-aminoethylphosphonate ABC transporter ATP-binding protein n=1 Tax=Flexibacterium corallicola TaxID=3037259 RepID=UPI00286F874D|nr:putative 2-aminoethylphosphonate ABC transporter ATP-binding protein [Pseudovibrio sp. M1P-2-3]